MKNNLCLIIISLFTCFLEESELITVLDRYTEASFWLASQYTLISKGRLRHASAAEHDEFQSFKASLLDTINPSGLIASWFLTWFIHDLSDFREAQLLFDHQCAMDTPIAPVYTAAAILILNAQQAKQLQNNPFELIVWVRQLAKQTPVKKIINCSQQLFILFPPTKLRLHHPKLIPTSATRPLNSIFNTRFWILLIVANVIYLLWTLYWSK